MSEHQPRALGEAWLDLMGGDKGWQTRFEAGLKSMQTQLPDTVETVQRCRQAAQNFAEMTAEDDAAPL